MRKVYKQDIREYYSSLRLIKIHSYRGTEIYAATMSNVEMDYKTLFDVLISL